VTFSVGVLRKTERDKAAYRANEVNWTEMVSQFCCFSSSHFSSSQFISFALYAP